MNLHLSRFVFRFIVLLVILPAAWGVWLLAIDTTPSSSGGSAEAQSKNVDSKAWKPEELDSLVAPIALYPDPLLAQVLAASTYPLELVEAHQWLKQHSNLKGKALTEAAAKEDWDASVQALVAFPDVLDRLTENIRWTTDLGNAFLSQQKDVMDAVQRLRLEAKNSGKLKSSREEEVTTKVVQEKTIVEIVPADPEVIYVPVYSPRVIWGAPVYYDYPALWYPLYPSAEDVWIDFGLGVTMGMFFDGWHNWYYNGWGWYNDWRWGWGWNSWGWGCGWGPYSNIIFNNHFCDHFGYHHRHYGYDHPGSWRHDPYHRAGVPYRGQDVARRYSTDNGRGVYNRGNTRGNYDLGNRSSISRQMQGRTTGRNPDAYRSSSLDRSRSDVVRNSRGDAISTTRSGDRTISINRSTDRRSFTTGNRGSDVGRAQSTDRSSYSRSYSAGGRSATNGTISIGRSADVGRSSYSRQSYSDGGSSYRSRSLSGSSPSYYNQSLYRNSPSYGSRSSYIGRSYSGGSSYSGRSYSGGGSSIGRSYSGGSTFSGRSYSSGGSSVGRSYSGGGSYRGSSSGGSSGGRSFGGGGGSHGGSSGGGHRR